MAAEQINSNHPILYKSVRYAFLIFQVETMAAKKLLVEKLSDLSSQKLDEFKSLIELEKGFPLGSKSRLKVANTQDVVELIVETYSQQSVEVTEKVLKKMKRTDLVHRLSIISLTSKGKTKETKYVKTTTASHSVTCLINCIFHKEEGCDLFLSLCTNYYNKYIYIWITNIFKSIQYCWIVNLNSDIVGFKCHCEMK